MTTIKFAVIFVAVAIGTQVGLSLPLRTLLFTGSLAVVVVARQTVVRDAAGFARKEILPNR